MKSASPTDWKTKKLPSKRSIIRINRTFSADEMSRIQRGLIPEQMEDKWFIYWKDSALHFHRSWTGLCIYVVRFDSDGTNHRIIEAAVNQDTRQHGASDAEREAEMVSYLIDVLLLGQKADFPSDEPSAAKRALLNWSQIGRAMPRQDVIEQLLGQEADPGDPSSSHS